MKRVDDDDDDDDIIVPNNIFATGADPDLILGLSLDGYNNSSITVSFYLHQRSMQCFKLYGSIAEAFQAYAFTLHTSKTLIGHPPKKYIHYCHFASIKTLFIESATVT